MSLLVDRSVSSFLGDLSAPSPTPGGGSAAAAAAAMGAALLAMVAALPRTRTGTPEERAALDRALGELAPLRDRLAECIDRDTESYDAVTAAYKLPKGSDEEKARRSSAIQQALRGATDVPLMVMRACVAAATSGQEVARCGNPSAASDAGAGFELLRAGLRGAAGNVRINLDGARDAAFVDATRAELPDLERSIDALVASAAGALARNA